MFQLKLITFKSLIMQQRERANLKLIKFLKIVNAWESQYLDVLKLFTLHYVKSRNVNQI